MADQGKWFKLWCSSLHDESLENLSLEDWARWARLGAYIKEHGRDGMIRFSPPYRALMNLFRVSTLEAAKLALNEFPNCTLGERNLTVSPGTVGPVSLEIEFTNWHKFQADLSSTRVRNFRSRKRQRETIQEEKRSRREVEEKRLTTTPIVPKGTASKVWEWFETTWNKYPKEGRTGRKAALRHYERDVKDVEQAREVARALEVYLQSKRVKEGFIQNASTWFNNWRDWKNDDRTGSEGFHSATHGPQQDSGNAGEREQAALAHIEIQRLADSKRIS